MDPLRQGLNLRCELLAAGLTDRQLRALRRAGELVLLRPGAYASGGGAGGHRLLAHAAVVALGEGTVLSHATAAVLHDLPLWATPLNHVHATRDRRSGARRSGVVHLHAARIEQDEVIRVDGLPVTSLARTLVDLARERPFPQALVPVDAALHAHRVTRGELDRALDRAARRPRNAAARQVIAFARPDAASVGESRSRLALHRAGLPPPVLQHRIVTDRGVVEVDFWWEELATAGEFDGRVKYGRLLRPGQDPGDAVFAEKLREDAIRAGGREVVRWTWPELDAFDAVAARLRAAFARRSR